MSEQKRPSRPRTLQPLESDELASRAGPLRKESQVKLGRTPKLPLSTGELELLPAFGSREAPTEGRDGVLPPKVS